MHLVLLYALSLPMPWTGIVAELEASLNWWVDERRDPYVRSVPLFRDDDTIVIFDSVHDEDPAAVPSPVPWA